MLCAGFATGGKDPCIGDSGGPIVKRTYVGDGNFVDTHVGVVSWGNGCALPQRPGVYSRTSKRASWIKSIVCTEWNSVASFCENTPSPSPPPSPCAENLSIRVLTDESASEIAMTLRRKNGRQILARYYLINNYQNEHHVCLESNRCYTFDLFHYGDNGFVNGSYELVLNEERIISGSGDFASRRNETICTGTEEPTPCTDGVPFRLGIQTDGSGHQTSWSLKEEGGDEIDSVVPFQYLPNTTVQEPGPVSSYCLKSDAYYYFVIYDPYGLCCLKGEGSYTGYLEGEKLFEGGEFESAETQSFCIGDATSLRPNSRYKILLHPHNTSRHQIGPLSRRSSMHPISSSTKSRDPVLGLL